MMFRVKQFLTLAGLAALEAVRQPLCVLLTTSCIVLNALVPLLLMHHFGEEGRLARDSGLALHLIIGLAVAGYTACSTLTREMRNGTASAVLSKPVGRELFFLSKFAGISVVIVAYSVCATVGTLLSERISERFVYTEEFVGHVTDVLTGAFLATGPFVAFALAGLINYRLKRPFESTAFGLVLLFTLGALLVSAFFDRQGRLAPFDFRVQWRVIPASALVTMALVMASAIALGLSTRLNTVPTMTVVGAIFILGLMSDHWFGRHSSKSVAALISYRLIPNWQHFWMSDALGGGGAIPMEYLWRAGYYAAACLAGILMMGVLLFRHAEVK